MWRIHHKPGVVERALREVQAIVREGRELVRSRTGYVKKLFRDWSGEEGTPLPAAVSAPKPAVIVPPPRNAHAERAAAQEAEDAERQKRFEDERQRWRERQRKAAEPS